MSAARLPVLFLLSFLSFAPAVLAGGSYASGDGMFTASWTFFNITIGLNVSCAVTGWCACGFGPDNSMPFTDIFWGFVKPNGTAYVVDRFSLAYAKPPADVHQDITLVRGYESAGKTFLEYTRALDLCHPNEDYALPKGSIWMLYSMSTSDPADPPTSPSDPDWNFSQHTYTGTYQITNFDSPLITPTCTPVPATTRPPTTTTTTSKTTTGATSSPSATVTSSSSSAAAAGASKKNSKGVSGGIIAVAVIVPCLVIGIAIVAFAIWKIKFSGKGSSGPTSNARSTEYVIDG